MRQLSIILNSGQGCTLTADENVASISSTLKDACPYCGRIECYAECDGSEGDIDGLESQEDMDQRRSVTMAETITVLIPTALRPHADDQATLDLSGSSVKEILGSLSDKYPQLAKRLFKTEGELNRFINVYVNDEDIRFMENLDTSVKTGDELSIVPAIAGGSRKSQVESRKGRGTDLRTIV